MTFTKLPKAISAEELLSTPLPPVKWIIPGLLPAGLALFAGPSKAGKSWLTLWLCLQIAQGNPVWDREIEPRTVIYFSLEDTFNRLQNRIFQLIDGGDAPERLILQTECLSIGQGLEEQVESLIHTYCDVGLIVIDTLQKVRVSNGNGGMYANDYKEAGALKKIADKYGICILLIKKKSERKFKITVCNGYKVNGQKRMKAQTIAVPSSVPKRGIQQYVMAEAERIEKKFKYGVEESDQTHFEQYAESWLKRQQPFFKATTYAGYKRNLDIVYPLIGGIPLAKLLPMTLEEMCEELRKRPGRGGNCIKETTVQKYLETVSSVLEDAKKNDIIPFNPAHRVRKKHFEKEVQHIPQKYEIRKLMQAIRDEPILYRAYYTLAITTGLRRGELCALQWRDITGACELTVRRSRSCASGQIVESDTKSHRERIVTIPLGIWELLMALRQQQMLHLANKK